MHVQIKGDGMTNPTIEAVFMNHSGGTKFYESVAIWSSERNAGVHIKRYGSIGASHSVGGGQLKVDYHHTQGSLMNAPPKS